MKWKTPCFPGFLPVVKEVQAGGVIGGRIDSSCPRAPSAISRARLGIKPSATQGLAKIPGCRVKAYDHDFRSFHDSPWLVACPSAEEKALPLPSGRATPLRPNTRR